MEGHQRHMLDAGSFFKTSASRYCQAKSPTRNSMKEQVFSPSLSRLNAADGHVCRVPLTFIPRVAMSWSSGGKRARGRPKETWRRSVEREMKALGWSWGQVTKQRIGNIGVLWCRPYV